jgi:uncharacterized protein (DUF427 family)
VTTPAAKPQIKIGPLVLEPTPRWIRAKVGDVTMADSKRVLLLWQESKVLPVYFFPRADVRTDLLRPSAHPLPEDHHEFASYWALELDERVIENAAWTYTSMLPLAGEWLEEYIALRWKAMDAWYEEEERVLGHPRDPYHRVDTRESSRHVRVVLEGETVADSRRPRLVFETGHPTRYYVTPEDVRMDLLTPSETRTLCAYKGEASYWSVNLGNEVYEDVAWSYPEPLPDNPQIRGLVCFFNERADIYVDDERLERPTTQWS